MTTIRTAKRSPLLLPRMEHSASGIMSESQDNNRTPEVTAENIEQMMSSSAGSEMTVDLITRVYEILKKIF